MESCAAIQHCPLLSSTITSPDYMVSATTRAWWRGVSVQVVAGELLLLRRALRLDRRLLLYAGACEDARQRVVAFVARVLVNLVWRLLQPDHERPRLRPGLGVVDRDHPVDVVGAHARESLGDLH